MSRTILPIKLPPVSRNASKSRFGNSNGCNDDTALLLRYLPKIFFENGRSAVNYILGSEKFFENLFFQPQYCRRYQLRYRHAIEFQCFLSEMGAASSASIQ